MKIAILCAMPEEAKLIIEEFSMKKNETDKHFDVYESEDLILLISKIGKIYATMGAKRLIQTYDIDMIINIGLAGSLKKEYEVGTVLLGEKIVQHDVFLPWEGEHLDYLKGEIYIVNKVEMLRKLGIDIDTVTILTGDQFIHNKEKIHELAKIGDIVDMEAFAIASVCKVFTRDLIVIKAISDNALLEENSKKEFEINIDKAMKNSIKLLKEVIVALR